MNDPINLPNGMSDPNILQNSCQFNSPAQSTITINQYPTTNLTISADGVLQNAISSNICTESNDVLLHGVHNELPAVKIITKQKESVLWLGRCHESRKVFNDFQQFKHLQKFNTNWELIQWLLKVGEKVIEQIHEKKDGGTNNIDSSAGDKNLSAYWVQDGDQRKLVLVPSYEDSNHGAQGANNQNNVINDYIDNDYINNEVTMTTNDNESETVCADEIIYQRYKKYLNKRDQEKQQTNKTLTIKQKSPVLKNQKRKQSHDQLIEDTDFIRVVKQAKFLKDFKLKDMNVESIKRLRHYPSKFSKFDFERIKELEKLENTLLTKSVCIVDNTTKEKLYVATVHPDEATIPMTILNTDHVRIVK